MLDWKTLPRPIIALSPMADMTDSAFCQTVKSMASPIMFREMISSEAVVRENAKTIHMADFVESERPLVQQLFGANPNTMAEAARMIEESHHPDGFDVNMGCPVYKITSNFNGAALMKEPVVAAEIIKKMKAAITVPLSIKIRLGWEDPTECLDFVKVIEDAGADLITIHGRTKAQGYSGVSDWDMISKCKKLVSIPVLANGDIHTAPLVFDALEQTGCDGVLIARGALGNPWIFKQIEKMIKENTNPETGLTRYEQGTIGKQSRIMDKDQSISIEERIRVIKLHANFHVQQYGERGLVTFRKHISWYLKGVPDVREFKMRLHQVNTMKELEEELEILEKNYTD